MQRLLFRKEDANLDPGKEEKLKLNRKAEFVVGPGNSLFDFTAILLWCTFP
jgi:hypothetical protein